MQSLRLTLRRALFFTAAASIGFGLALGLAGCPGAAELEDPQRFGVLTGETGRDGGGGGPPHALPDAGCDYVQALDDGCARSGCHQWRGMLDASALLDLTPDEFLWNRIVDVPATYAHIDCDAAPGNQFCVPPGCADAGTLLIDSRNPDRSWILQKIRAWDGGANENIGCGMDMPVVSSDTTFSEQRKACLEQMVRALAAAAATGG